MIYWISTGLVTAMLTMSALAYLLHKATIDGVRDLGFPDHFRIELAVLKLLAVIVLLAPQMPVPVKEWAYAGVALFFVTSIVAHTAHGDPWTFNLINVVLLLLLATSRYYHPGL
ncbi:MAG: DoxX family protein [Pelagimonas sp.]|uniref:DoxX family protein n=1 Tax=Pelagimonas sp. TaxID=2073170 RepID=UPI003D6C64DF